MMTNKEAIKVFKTELEARSKGYYDYLANGGQGDCEEEARLDALQLTIEALEIADRLEHMDENPKISSEDATIYDKFYDDGFAEGYNYACMMMRGNLEEAFCEVIKTLEEMHNED